MSKSDFPVPWMPEVLERVTEAANDLDRLHLRSRLPGQGTSEQRKKTSGTQANVLGLRMETK